jgi:hypothetical protein
VDGDNNLIFFVPGTAVGPATLNNLTLTHGSSSSGGGILNNGTLTVSNCTLMGNSATAAR